MASLGFIESLLGSLPDPVTRNVLQQIFRETLRFTRFGSISHQQPTQFGAQIYLQSTTASSTNEFSILHGLGRAPYLGMLVLPLDSTGARNLTLTISRVADAQRIYLRSETTSAPFVLMIE